jgi:hypothetical protein
MEDSGYCNNARKDTRSAKNHQIASDTLFIGSRLELGTRHSVGPTYRMLWNAEENEGFSDEEGRSRPGQGSIDVMVMFQKRSYQLSEMTKTTLGTFDNDAQACYDRIVISLSMRKLGMPENAVKLHATFHPMTHSSNPTDCFHMLSDLGLYQSDNILQLPDLD